MFFGRHLLELLDQFDVDVEVLGLEAGEHAAEVAFWDVGGGFDLAGQYPFADWRVAVPGLLVYMSSRAPLLMGS